MKKSLLFFLLTILLVACASNAGPALKSTASPVPVTSATKPVLTTPSWWQQAVFYEIFVRSFYDSNGDGIGDFNGITSKLDYLKSLGITGIWLMPIHPSTSYHGYDVLNYYAVNPQYGSLDDFKKMLKEAHARGIRIIIDLVLNHTSSQHPWFIDANSKPNSKYRNWYLWSDTELSNKWYPGNTGFYYAYFGNSMPDLNYRNPEVTNQIEKITDYWLNTIGVDGFRIDAAKHLIEEGNKLENTPSTHAWFQGFYTFYKNDKSDAYVVGEVSNAGGLIAKTYFGQMDQIFNFELASAVLNSVGGGATSSINSSFQLTLKDKPDNNYAIFLTNHDQNRVMSVLHGDVNKAKVAASLLLTSPGTPFIYYGEEIGMQGEKPDEDIRLPMQWSADPRTAGFSSSTPWRVPHTTTSIFNVAMEENINNSLLNHYRALIALRNQHPALQTGSFILLDTGNPGVFASLRIDGTDVILTVINLTSETVDNFQISSQTLTIPSGAFQPQIIFGSGKIASLQTSNGKIDSYKPVESLSPFSTLVISISP